MILLLDFSHFLPIHFSIYFDILNFLESCNLIIPEHLKQWLKDWSFTRQIRLCPVLNDKIR